MKLKFKSPKLNLTMKCTTEPVGRLRFSKSAVIHLEIEKDSHFLIGINEDDPKDRNIYLIKTGPSNKNGYKINVSGKGRSYYLNIKNVLEELEYDYRSKKVTFSIDEVFDEDVNDTIYILKEVK